MEPGRIDELIEQVIDLSGSCEPEDAKPRPRVAALLVNRDGQVELTAYRGEGGAGWHAEYTLIEKAKSQNIALEGKTVFVTLEPCTTRNPPKQACADRLVRSGVARVYIGMLDPNPVISGKGELRLQHSGVEVERFPARFYHRLVEKSQKFVDEYGSEHLPPTSPYVRMQIPQLVSAHLKSLGVAVPDLPIEWDTTVSHLTDRLRGVASLEQIDEARGEAFDQKYAAQDPRGDARGIRDAWKRDFDTVTARLGMEPGSYRELSVIDVGIGNGAKEHELLTPFKNVTLVDIAPRSLEAARVLLPDATSHVCSAESLGTLELGQHDLYVSLRTFQSTYFDIPAALRSARHVLRSGGVAVISIANGFVVSDNQVLPGLVIPGTTYVDTTRPHSLAQRTREELERAGFGETGIYTGYDEVFVFGRRVA